MEPIVDREIECESCGNVIGVDDLVEYCCECGRALCDDCYSVTDSTCPDCYPSGSYIDEL